MSIDVPDGYLGASARITSGPAPEMVATGYELEIADAPLLHDGLNFADMAHVLSLLDAEVLPRAAASAILDELLRFADTAPEDFPYDATYGDAYNSREKELQRRIGTSAGWLHTGRTRREAGRIAFRLALRRSMLELHDAVSSLASALANAAERFASATWADTTYLQPAQPSTFGHYLGAFGEETLRHLDRIHAAYRWVNRSPTGCGGVGGSPILPHRRRDALALGFDEPGFNTRDIMWSVDGLVDVALAGTHAVSTLDRLCEDLEIFSAPSFGYVSLHPSLCRASVLMPQKRNPYALPVIRSGANVLIGRTAGLLAAQRTPSARTDNWLHGYGETAYAVDQATRLVRLGTVIIETLAVNTERLGEDAGSHFTGAADLAEHLVISDELDYRTAYQVVGNAVARAVADDRAGLTGDDFVAAWEELIGGAPPPGLDIDTLTDPVRIVAARDVLGGSAPRRVVEHAGRLRAQVGAAETWRTNAYLAINMAEQTIVARARATIAG